MQTSIASFYDDVHVEPTDASFLDAARFAREGRFDAYVSVGGGSIIDTCKAASLYATFPADFLDYVNAPVGAGKPVPGALPPHIACPTTCGTGSETHRHRRLRRARAEGEDGHRVARLRPSLALVDPTCTYTLPAEVVAASGFDVLCHALESYTARPFSSRARTAAAATDEPGREPVERSREPRGAAHRRREPRGARSKDSDARRAKQLAWAATLAGIAFGNAGVHVPHAMAYAVAGLVRDFRMHGYPQEKRWCRTASRSC